MTKIHRGELQDIIEKYIGPNSGEIRRTLRACITEMWMIEQGMNIKPSEMEKSIIYETMFQLNTFGEISYLEEV
jgi:hypothetical protein